MQHQEPSGANAIGRVLRTGPRGVLIVEPDDTPAPLGTRCRTKAGKDAGRVTDVIGPVDRPILVVNPRGRGKRAKGRPNPGDLVGATLYAR